MFIFGEDVDGVNKIRAKLSNGLKDYCGEQLKKCFAAIYDGTFGDCSIVHGVLDAMTTGGDHYITCFDFYTYLQAHERADE